MNVELEESNVTEYEVEENIIEQTIVLDVENAIDLIKYSHICSIYFKF